MICADCLLQPLNDSQKEWENRTSKTVPKPLEVCCSNAPKNQIASMRDASPSFWSIPIMSSLVRNGERLYLPWFTYDSYDLFNQKFRKDESGIKQEGGSVFSVGLPDLKVRKKGKFVGSWDIPCEAVFEAWVSAMAPSIRWSSGLRRPYSLFDKETGLRGKTSWGALKDGFEGEEVRHCMVLDFDHVRMDAPLEDINDFCLEHGFNGTIVNNKGTELSLSVPVHFTHLIPAKAVHLMADFLGEVFREKFGLEIDYTGSKGWMCKNLWMVKKLEEAAEQGLPLEVGNKTWYNWSQARRDWKKHESWWFGFSEDGTIPLQGSWSQHAEVFHEELKDPSLFFSSFSSLSLSSSSLSSCFKEVNLLDEKKPKKLKKKQTSGQKVIDPDNSREGYVFKNALPEIKKLIAKTGKLEPDMKDDFISMCERLEKSSPEFIRKGKTMKDEGDNWIEERYWKFCLKQPKEYWAKMKVKTCEKGTLRLKAGRIMRTFKFASENKVKGGDQRFVDSFQKFKKDSIFTNPYIQKTINDEKTSKKTLALYRKTIRDWDGCVKEIKEILKEGTGLDFLDSSLSFLALLSSSSSCFKEVNLSGKKDFKEMRKRIETLKTQTEEDNEPQTKWTAEDEKWLHVEKVDNFDHLNTDLENRMMGRDYIRDAERYHTEGLFGMRDEAVHAARSYGYIGGFSWESEQGSLDWAGIHSKVFETEETAKESKTTKTTVSFADIRARLNRMKGAGNA